mmetsp:Transcript_13903/g.29704  ORF Transcript_13903/g.29704 Transcript_13903/m.29704 type:complete len:213 (-) Transcript_13903:1205-1843(-)
MRVAQDLQPEPGGDRPRDDGHHREGEEPPVEGPGAHPLRELHLPLRDAGRRLHHDQQILRGVPRRALLRRQRVHRPVGAAVPGARAEGVRPGPRQVGRQRAVPLRLPLQPAGVHRAAAAARPHHGARPAPRRPSEPRLPDPLQEDLGGVHLLRDVPLPAGREHRPDRLRQDGGDGEAVPPQAAGGGHLRLRPRHRLRPHAQGGGRARLVAAG